jgi:hypothetical protein
MAFAFGGAGALLKAFIPTFPGLTARRSIAAAGRRLGRRDTASRPPVIVLSPEAEAALAPLGLPPDGPIDPNATQRARLAPDVAARNFVCWARALDLDGVYGTRSVYALYCEFSEVDGRPPLRDARFLDALAQTPGIATVPRGKDKGCRLWRWTIEPAKPVPVPVAEAIADVWTHVSAPASNRAAKTTTSVPDPEPAPTVTAPAVPQALAADARASASARTPEIAAPGHVAEATAHARATKVAAPARGRVSKVTAPAAPQALAADVRQSEAPAPRCAQEAAKSTAAQASASASPSASVLSTSTNAPAKAVRSAIVLTRFVADTEHPFSPAGLREREKSARRLRLYAAASRKQRGALRRAA